MFTGNPRTISSVSALSDIDDDDDDHDEGAAGDDALDERAAGDAAAAAAEPSAAEYAHTAARAPSPVALADANPVAAALAIADVSERGCSGASPHREHVLALQQLGAGRTADDPRVGAADEAVHCDGVVDNGMDTVTAALLLQSTLSGSGSPAVAGGVEPLATPPPHCTSGTSGTLDASGPDEENGMADGERPTSSGVGQLLERRCAAALGTTAYRSDEDVLQACVETNSSWDLVEACGLWPRLVRQGGASALPPVGLLNSEQLVCFANSVLQVRGGP